MTDSDTDPSLPLPRILCLHGGGVNAQVFRLQCRSIIRSGLSPHFRFVFVDGPFVCKPHPAIVPVYGEFGPFYRWLRWMDEHEEMDAEGVSSEILGAIRRAMRADEGTGEWVGVLGFSQGAKIAASLLWNQEWLKKRGKGESLLEGVYLRFGVLMAGSAPTVMLDPVGRWRVPRHVETADKISMSFQDWPKSSEDGDGEHAVAVPTLHVHGLKDPGIERHKKLLELYCKRGSTRLVEWDGDHRLPIKRADVDLIVAKVLEMAWETGLL